MASNNNGSRHDVDNKFLDTIAYPQQMTISECLSHLKQYTVVQIVRRGCPYCSTTMHLADQISDRVSTCSLYLDSLGEISTFRRYFKYNGTFPYIFIQLSDAKQPHHHLLDGSVGFRRFCEVVKTFAASESEVPITLENCKFIRLEAFQSV